MPIFNWLDDVTDTPWVSRTIQGGLAALGFAIGGDPFGLVAAPVCWGIQEYMRQRQRLIDNDDPEAVQGLKFGYVREGDTWYPAYVTSRERDEGWLGSNHTQMRLEYGKDLRWKQKKGSDKWVPYFEDGAYKLKDFHTWDSYLDTDNESGYDYLMQTDPLRDFYLLSDEETDKMIKGFGGGDTLQKGKTEYTAEEQQKIEADQAAAYGSFKAYKDPGWDAYWQSNPEWVGIRGAQATKYASGSGAGFAQDTSMTPEDRLKYGRYVDQLQDLRKSFDFMQDYRYSDVGQIQASNHGENEFMGSRKLWKTINDAGEDTVGSSGQLMGNNMKNGLKHFQEVPEMRYMVEEYVTAVNDLYGAQKRAGNSMGFDKLYTGGLVPEMGYGYMFYQDNAWEFGTLDTADQLREALRKIEESGDADHAGTEHYRSADQRSYLSQKAWARYLHSKINQLGGADYVHGPGVTNTNVPNPFAQSRSFVGGVRANTDYMSSQIHYDPNWNIERDYGYDPMYSELDDGGSDYQSYGTTIVHRDADWNEDTNSDKVARDWMHTQISGTGVFDGVQDPDYVAGRFKDELAYNEWMDYQIDEGAPEEFWDESQGKMVLAGEQGENTYWDDETRSYKPIEEDAAVIPSLDTGAAVTSQDLDAGWTTETADDDIVWETDEEWQTRLDAEAALQAEIAAAQADAAADADAKAAADADAKAAAAAAAKPQTVPDETPGATAPHEYIYHEQHHEAMHLAPDFTAPMHIKTI